jgi:hypothetical protein
LAKTTEQRGDVVREGRIPVLPGAVALDLRTLGTSKDDVDLDLTALLRCILVGRHVRGKTWAQLVAEGWIVDALEGNPRAIEDILDRTEKGRLAAALQADACPPIDDETVGQILEILCGSGDVATSA